MMPKGFTHTEETRAKIAEASVNHWKQPEFRARVSKAVGDALRGRKHRPDCPHCIQETGPSRWKQKDPSYGAVHKYLRRVLPLVCAPCGDTVGPFECALLKDASKGAIRVSHTGGVYSVNPAHYVRMCLSCHRAYDKGASLDFIFDRTRQWGQSSHISSI